MGTLFRLSALAVAAEGVDELMQALCDKHGWYKPTGKKPSCPDCYRNQDLRAVGKRPQGLVAR